MISFTYSCHPSKVKGAEPAPAHPNEIDRLGSLCGLMLLEGESEPLFDRIALRAASLCATPIALVTALRGDDQIFVGRAGSTQTQTAREESFCAYTILGSEPLVVPDARLDPRFASLDVVVGEPFVRFYAGAPIRDASGLPLGSVCVIDTKPRDASPESLTELARLATLVSDILEARRLAMHLLGPTPTPFELMTTLDRLAKVLEPFIARDGGETPVAWAEKSHSAMPQ